MSSVMRWEGAGEEILANLEAEGLVDAEIYVKKGRARRLTLDRDVRSWSDSREIGWAVRAASARGSFFLARAGEPEPVVWPAAGPGEITLPAASVGEPYRRAESERALVTEGEAIHLLTELRDRLAGELAGALVSQAFVEDGSSEAEILSSRGVRCHDRRRTAALRVVGNVRSRVGVETVALYVASKTAHDFQPAVLARRLAERLVLAGGASLDRAAAADCTLAPEVGARILAGCIDRLVGPEAPERGRQHRWGRREGMTVVDDPRAADGPLSSGWDGEGVPTRRVVLVEAGRYMQPLVAWWQAAAPELASGCTQRASWRDLPAVGPTQLAVEPGGDRGSDLVASIEHGFHWCDALAGGVFDGRADRFTLPVTGYALAPGRDPVPVRCALLCGSITGLLESIDGVGDDLRFIASRSLVGAPTLRVPGLQVEPL